MHINVFKKHGRHTQSLAIKQYLTSKSSDVSNDPNEEHIHDEHEGNWNMT